MFRTHYARLLGSAAIIALASGGTAWADDASFNIQPQSLNTALNAFSEQSAHPVLFKSEMAVEKLSPGVRGEADPEVALAQLLQGTGLSYRRAGDTFVIVQGGSADPQSSSAAGDGADSTVEALIVTAQKREEDIQDVPIAISAFTQESLERSQIAGGPDLMTQVPNMTFTKTNFTGYSIQIRGIGTQAISATTDAAVAVAFNNTPFIRNRFFEQEFYDLQRVEVLRGPQGTLYGRNATAGVVNLISAKPKFGYEAKISADVANYSSTRLEGMINLPLVDDKVAVRLAGAWTKREGFVTNEITGNPIDGRDLWSTRLSLRIAPTDALDINLIWEHFQEEDDRLRSGKQLCHQDDRETVSGLKVQWQGYGDLYSQGCMPASLYSPDSFEAPNGFSLPYFLPLKELGVPIAPGFNPYTRQTQSTDLRVIESTVDPKYRSNGDLVELQWSLDLGDSLTLASETAYNYDTIYSLEDFNRFNTASGAFVPGQGFHRAGYMQEGPNGGIFCDPQIGCADRLVAMDVSTAKSSQFSQEFRLSSNYDGSFNFSLGANFLRYDTEDKYYVFINTLTMLAAGGGYQVFGNLRPWIPGVTDNSECLTRGQLPPDTTDYELLSGCIYIDPNPVENVNDRGRNYFLSRNPYKLISYAVFGEAYYELTDNLKLTAGLRWTVDKKEAPRIPSWLLGSNHVGLGVKDVEEQEWREPTGRLTLDWKPDLSFTDETLLYASFAHGYKAGGSNPPPNGTVSWGLDGTGASTEDAEIVVRQSVSKPKIFDPEFVNAFEIGAKNTMLDGAMTLNLAAFYYDYTGYQISQIIDRSAVNYNFDSKIWGLEIEADWRPLENLRLSFKGGYEHTRIADGERAIDIMDRTAGRDDWMVIRAAPWFPSNCILPTYMFNARGDNVTTLGRQVALGGYPGPCELAYLLNLDPGTQLPYVANPVEGKASRDGGVYLLAEDGWLNYPGYNPEADVGQNHGEGFFKQLGGNELPNAPHVTATITADYTAPLPSDWLMTLHTDLYYQSEAWTRVFNMEGYDKLKAYTNVNLAAIFTNEDAGWKVMAYVKNVLDRDSITGAFLNSDDTGLTTNVFLTEPRLYGLRVTKQFSGGPWWTGAGALRTGPYPLTVEIGGSALRQDAPYATLAPAFTEEFSEALNPTAAQHRDVDWGDGREVRVTYRPGGGGFSLSAGFRSAETNSGTTHLHGAEAAGPLRCPWPPEQLPGFCEPGGPFYSLMVTGTNWSDGAAREDEEYQFADFTIGKDVALGSLGNSHASIAAGLRYGQFRSTTVATMDGVPDTYVPDGWVIGYTYRTTYTHHRAVVEGKREFEGVGPALTWDAAQRLIGDRDSGHLDLSWAITGGVLFGKQKTEVIGQQGQAYTSGSYLAVGNVLEELEPVAFDIPERRRSVTVPFVDLSLGLSYEIQRVKIGAGYRWERYFDVLDAGYAEHKDYDRTIDGPYFKLSVGFGG